MSTPTSSRSSMRTTAQRPSTPDQMISSVSRSGSVSVAPRSKYLQDALQARRAQNTPTALSQESSYATPATTQDESRTVRSVMSEEDLEFSLTEEQMAPVSPLRRGRPSDVGVSRTKTNKELTDQIGKLKDALITANMRVELLKTNNTELQHGITKAMERAEELEPLQDENEELRNENAHLLSKVEYLEQEVARVREDNENVRKSNEELLATTEECASHYEEQDAAIQEAADTIIALETEKANLALEFKKLVERVSALEDGSSRTPTLFDGSPGYPSRIYSIDESRPSTSHFDSDYYSQPASPQVKPSADSIVSLTPSERSKKFLSSTDERRRSGRDLIKRLSAASLKAMNVRCPSPAPSVPEIPAAFLHQVPQIVEQPVENSQPARTPRRYRDRRLPSQSLLDAVQVSPTKPPTVSSESLSSHTDRRREHTPTETTSRKPSSVTTARARNRRPSGTEISPRIPSRLSSRAAQSSSSTEHLSQQSSNDHHRHHRRQSESTLSFGEGSMEASSTEWASSSMPPPPVPVARSQTASIISDSDLTEADPADIKNDWWRGVGRLNQQPPLRRPGSTHPPDAFLPTSSRPPASPSLIRSKSHVVAQATQAITQPTRLDITARVMKTPSKDRSTSGPRLARTVPNTPDATPYVENFFFNPSEDVDTFMKKAKSKLSGRK